MGPLEIMLMSCIGAFFGSLLKDIVMDFAMQDEELAEFLCKWDSCQSMDNRQRGAAWWQAHYTEQYAQDFTR